MRMTMRMFISIFVFLTLIVFNQKIESYPVQSSANVNCTVNSNGHILRDGQGIEIQGKYHKVEDCALHRAYHACGAHLLYIINIVCQAIKQENGSGKHRYRRFSRRKLLTEACCEQLCTVSEMTRYCPQ